MLPNWLTLRRRRKHTGSQQPLLPKAYLHCEALEKRLLLFGPGHGFGPPVAVSDSYNVLHNHALSVAAPGVLANDSSGSGGALSAVLQSNPGHGSLTFNANGSFTYTPQTNFAGSDSFTYEAYDGSSYSSPATVTVNVTDQPPVVLNPGSQSGNEGNSVALAMSASDADGDPLSFSASSLPAGLTINAGTGLISGTLGNQSAGTYTTTVTASDGITTGSASFTWTVADTTTPTLTNPGHQLNQAGSSISLTIASADADNDALRFTATGLPTGLSINSTGLISGTINGNVSGTSTVTVTASDGSNQASVSFSWQVASLSPPVLTNPGTQNNAEADAVSLPLAASDPNGLTISYAASGLPAGLSIDGNTGIISGTISYGAAQVNGGRYSVTATVTDQVGASASQTFSWTIAHTNRPPVATNESITATADNALVFTLTASDPDNDPLTYQVVGNPSHGTVSLAGSTATYTPAAHYLGSDSFTFKANDGQADSNTATVSLTVQAAPITANGRNVSANAAGSGSLLVATFTSGDPLAAAAQFSATIAWGDGQTSAGTVTADTGGGFDVSGSHAYAEHGILPTQVTISDSGSSSATASGSANVPFGVNSNAQSAGGVNFLPSGSTPAAGQVSNALGVGVPTGSSSASSGSPFNRAIPIGSNGRAGGSSGSTPNGSLANQWLRGQQTNRSSGGAGGQGTVPLSPNSPLASGSIDVAGGSLPAAGSFSLSVGSLPTGGSSGGGLNPITPGYHSYSWTVHQSTSNADGSTTTIDETISYYYSGLPYATPDAGDFSVTVTYGYSFTMHAVTAGSNRTVTEDESDSYNYVMQLTGSGDTVSYTIDDSGADSLSSTATGSSSQSGSSGSNSNTYTQQSQSNDSYTLHETGSSSQSGSTSNSYSFASSGSSSSNDQESGTATMTGADNSSGSDTYTYQASTADNHSYTESGSASNGTSMTSSNYSDTGNSTSSWTDHGSETMNSPAGQDVALQAGGSSSTPPTDQTTDSFADTAGSNSTYTITVTGSNGAFTTVMNQSGSDTSTAGDQGTDTYDDISGVADPRTADASATIAQEDQGSDNFNNTDTGNDGYTLAESYSYDGSQYTLNSLSETETGGDNFTTQDQSSDTVHDTGTGLNDTSTGATNASDQGSDTFTVQISGSGNTVTVTLDGSGQDQPTSSDQGTENFDQTAAASVAGANSPGGTGSNNSAALGNQWSDTVTGGNVTEEDKGSDNFTDSDTGKGNVTLHEVDTYTNGVAAVTSFSLDATSSDTFTSTDKVNDTWTDDSSQQDQASLTAADSSQSSGSATGGSSDHEQASGTFNETDGGTDSVKLHISGSGNSYTATVHEGMSDTYQDSEADNTTFNDSSTLNSSELDPTAGASAAGQATAAATNGGVTETDQGSEQGSGTDKGTDNGSLDESMTIDLAANTVTLNSFSFTDNGSDNFTAGDTGTANVTDQGNSNTANVVSDGNSSTASLNDTATDTFSAGDTGTGTYTVSVSGDANSYTVTQTSTVTDNYQSSDSWSDQWNDSGTGQGKNVAQSADPNAPTVTTLGTATVTDQGNDQETVQDGGQETVTESETLTVANSAATLTNVTLSITGQDTSTDNVSGVDTITANGTSNTAITDPTSQVVGGTDTATDQEQATDNFTQKVTATDNYSETISGSGTTYTVTTGDSITDNYQTSDQGNDQFNDGNTEQGTAAGQSANATNTVGDQGGDTFQMNDQGSDTLSDSNTTTYANGVATPGSFSMDASGQDAPSISENGTETVTDDGSNVASDLQNAAVGSSSSGTANVHDKGVDNFNDQQTATDSYSEHISGTGASYTTTMDESESVSSQNSNQDTQTFDDTGTNLLGDTASNGSSPSNAEQADGSEGMNIGSNDSENIGFHEVLSVASGVATITGLSVTIGGNDSSTEADNGTATLDDSGSNSNLHSTDNFTDRNAFGDNYTITVTGSGTTFTTTVDVGGTENATNSDGFGDSGSSSGIGGNWQTGFLASIQNAPAGQTPVSDTGSDSGSDNETNGDSFSMHEVVTTNGDQTTITDFSLSASGSDSFGDSEKGSDTAGQATDSFTETDHGGDEFTLSETGSSPNGVFQVDSFHYHADGSYTETDDSAASDGTHTNDTDETITESYNVDESGSGDNITFTETDNTTTTTDNPSSSSDPANTYNADTSSTTTLQRASNGTIGSDSPVVSSFTQQKNTQSHSSSAGSGTNSNGSTFVNSSSSSTTTSLVTNGSEANGVTVIASLSYSSTTSGQVNTQTTNPDGSTSQTSTPSSSTTAETGSDSAGYTHDYYWSTVSNWVNTASDGSSTSGSSPSDGRSEQVSTVTSQSPQDLQLSMLEAPAGPSDAVNLELAAFALAAPPVAAEPERWHHLIPQTLAGETGIDKIVNIHLKEFARMMPASLHTELEKAGWELDWAAWISKQKGTISAQQIQAKIKDMMTSDKYKAFFKDPRVRMPDFANYMDYLKGGKRYSDILKRVTDAETALKSAKTTAEIAKAKDALAKARNALTTVEKQYEFERILGQMKYKYASRLLQTGKGSRLLALLGRLAKNPVIRVGGKLLVVVGNVLMVVDVVNAANRVDYLNALRDATKELNKLLIDALRATPYQLPESTLVPLKQYYLSLRRLVEMDDELAAQNPALKKVLIEILDAIQHNINIAAGTEGGGFWVFPEGGDPSFPPRQPPPTEDD